MRGVYLLVIDVQVKTDIRVGALGMVSFEQGIWVYVGSAMGSGSTSIENRLKRHFSERKTVHWHIDYLLSGGGVPVSAIWAESEEKRECDMAAALLKHQDFIPGPTGFGSSDCTRRCGTHIFHCVGDYSGIIERIQEIVRSFDLIPNTMSAEGQ